MSSSSDPRKMTGSDREVTVKMKVTGKKTFPSGKFRIRGEGKMSCMYPPCNTEGPVIHTLYPLGAVGGLLSSTSLSKQCLKVELREMENT